MKPQHYLLGAILTVLLTAGDKPLHMDKATGKAEVEEDSFCGRCRPSRWHTGEKDGQGRLVVFEAAGLCKTLESDYALTFINTGDENHPAARYDLSSRESGLIPSIHNAWRTHGANQ
jgi:hypothetical protein